MNYFRFKERIRENLKDKNTIKYKLAYSIHRVVLHLVYGNYGIFRVRFFIGKIQRQNGKHDAKYEKLRNLRDKYSGERCFIIATGPSLRTEDVEKLNNEYTFGMNSLVRMYSKINWRPTFYVMQDCDVFKSNEAELMYYDKGESTFFIADIVKRYARSKISLRNIIYYSQDLHNHNCMTERNYANPVKPVFSEDCYLCVEDGFTVTYSAMQIAIYMGFREIYLLGADCDYSNIETRFENHVCSPEKQMMLSYQVAYEYAQKNNIKVFNATRGGKLEVFPRVDFDDLNLN